MVIIHRQRVRETGPRKRGQITILTKTTYRLVRLQSSGVIDSVVASSWPVSREAGNSKPNSVETCFDIYVPPVLLTNNIGSLTSTVRRKITWIGEGWPSDLIY